MNAVIKIPREFLFLAEETSGDFGSWGHITSNRVDHFRKLTKLVIDMFSVHPPIWILRMTSSTKNPRVKTLHKIALAFNMTLAEFLDFDELNDYSFDDDSDDE